MTPVERLKSAVTKIICDRCGKEIPYLKDMIAVDIRPWDKPTQVRRIELCEWCAKCLIDWVKSDG